MKKKVKVLIIAMCILFLTACSCSMKKDENNGSKNGESGNNGSSNVVDNSNSSNTSNGGNSGGSNGGSESQAKEVPYTLTASEKERSEFILENLTPKTGSVDFDKLSENEKAKILIDMATELYYRQTKKSSINNPEKVFTKDKLTQILHDYFGENATMKFKDYLCEFCNKAIYQYDKKKQAYVFSSIGHHHEPKIVQIYTQSKGVYKQGNIVKIKYKTMFSEPVEKSVPKTFYKSYNNAKKKKNPAANSSKYCKIYDSKKSNCNMDKMLNDNNFYTFVYKFEKKNNKFYYIGYEVEV